MQEISNCLVTYCKAVRLMCFTNGHTIVFLPQTKRRYNIIHITDSVKVALGLWALGIVPWEDNYCLVVTQVYHCSVFHMPKYPTANNQLLNQPSLN